MGQGGDAEGDVIVNIEHLMGSFHEDELTGDNGDNQLNGLHGDDVLHGNRRPGRAVRRRWALTGWTVEKGRIPYTTWVPMRG